MTSLPSYLTERPDLARSSAEDAGEGNEVNVSNNERLLSAVGGGVLAMYGLKRGGFSGVLLLAAGGALVYRGYTGHCSGYAALGVNMADQGPAEPRAYYQHGIHVEESVSINKTPWELYEYWKNFENLPLFMDHLKSVKKLDDRRSHWVAKAPAGMTVEWGAEIINDEPNALIAWRSLGGASVDNAGSVRFVPGAEGRGTEVKVVLDYIPPAGRFGAAVARVFGEDPGRQIADDLRHFKQIMETGDVLTNAGQPADGVGGSA